MFSSNNKISIRQLQILLILDIFGMGITFLPKEMVEFAGQSGWICVIIGSILACICVFILMSLAEKFPNDSFITYCGKIVTKPISYIITIGFILKIILTVSMELRIFSEIVKQTILFNTPYYIISICMLLLGAYGALKGYESRGRIAEILIFIIFIPLLIIFSFVASNADYTNLLPFFDFNNKNLLLGSIVSLFMFSGIEFVLLAYPYLNNPQKAKKESIKAVIFIGLIMSIITLITIAKFGAFDIKNQIWPVLELMNAVDIPGAFLERQDAIVMSFWIMSVFIIINSGIFFSSLLSKDVIKRGKNFWYTIAISIVVFFVSIVPNDIKQIINFTNRIYIYFGAIYSFLIPLLLLIIAKIRKVGDNVEKN